MEFLYFPGCSLEGSGRRLGKGLKKLLALLGMELREVPDWNCCGASEYGNKGAIIALSLRNIEKARGLGDTLLAPCPCCAKNLKEAGGGLHVMHPLDLLHLGLLSSVDVKREAKGEVFTPFYGCLLLRPEGTAIRNQYVMEEFIEFFGGRADADKVRDLCCGGGQLFRQKEITGRMVERILSRSQGTILVFCPLCYMAISTFSRGRKVVYFTDFLLYLLGERA